MNRLPLSGIDVMLLGLDRIMIKKAGRNNLAQLVVQCDGIVQAEQIRESVKRFSAVVPWGGARLSRSFGVSAPYWQTVPDSLPQVRDRTGEDLGQVLHQNLNARLDPRVDVPLRFDIVPTRDPQGGGVETFVVMSWFHSLMDPRGAECLLIHLNELFEKQVSEVWPDGVPSFSPEKSRRPYREKFRLSGVGRRYIDGFKSDPPVPLARLSPGNNERSVTFRCRTYPEAEGDLNPGRMTKEAMFRLALAGKSLAPLWHRRGVAKPRFLLPMSVDQRRKGDLNVVFNNFLALHFPHFDAAGDVGEIAGKLRIQMMEALRSGVLEATMEAMDIIRFMPVSFLAWRAGFSREGDLASFNFADTGDAALSGLDFFGCRVKNTYHVPTVPPNPGLGVFLNTCSGQRNVVAAWVEGLLEEEEILPVMDGIARGLGWLQQDAGTPTHGVR